MDIGGGISEELVEGMFVPGDARRLEGGRIAVPGLGPALTAEYARERRADLVLARCRRMACGAAREYLLARGGVPSRPGGGGRKQSVHPCGNREYRDN